MDDSERALRSEFERKRRLEVAKARGAAAMIASSNTSRLATKLFPRPPNELARRAQLLRERVELEKRVRAYHTNEQCREQDYRVYMQRREEEFQRCEQVRIAEEHRFAHLNAVEERYEAEQREMQATIERENKRMELERARRRAVGEPEEEVGVLMRKIDIFGREWQPVFCTII